MRSHCLPLVLALLTGALACGSHDADPAGATRPLAAGEILAGNATVRFVSIEGGCWALETAIGRYEPVALPAAYRTDGRAVYVVLRAAPPVSTTCMIAPLVVIDTIRAP
jgi:hypothetical protein